MPSRPRARIGGGRARAASPDGRSRRLAEALRRGEAGAFAVEEAARLPEVAYAVLFAVARGRLGAVASSVGAPPLEAAPPLVHRALASAACVRERGRLALPVRVPGASPLGALLVAAGSTLGAETEECVAGLAELAAALLENEQRLSASATEARQDALTGLRNRRAFEEHVDRLVSAGEAGELALVFCDLDDFKSVNDHQGYAAGDEVLRQVARAFTAELRPGEELFRIGGDEFAVVLLGGSTVGQIVAERLEVALAGRRRGPRLPTVSTGIAVSPADGRRPDELVGHAANALVERRRAGQPGAPAFAPPVRRLRLLAVDDDPALRLLLRTTFELADITVEEAASAEEARAAILREQPDVVVLDVSLPGAGGLQLSRALRADPETAPIPIVLLTGGDLDPLAAVAAGADALVRKPFSPLELLATVERITETAPAPRLATVAAAGSSDDQLLLYAGDLRRLLELERRQRRALQSAYRETVGALAGALEMRDTGTGAHSLRVQRYASELAAATAPRLLDDPGVEYGFLLHDIGKIALPDSVLQKPGPLTPDEWRIMRTHAPVGAALLSEIAQLRGEGLAVVRHHHERWDGGGYPGGLRGTAIPLGARIFAVADALDAMTSDRPYRRAGPWERAVEEIRREAGRQFDPAVAAAFAERHGELRRIQREFAAA